MLFKSQKIDLLIVGLGNPGDEYDNSLHNVGFDVIDRLAQDLGANYWKDECGALTAHVTNDDKSIILVKPQSFMNNSGSPVSALCKKYKLSVRDLVVISDDLDLEPGTFRAKRGGGSGGHNGIKSIQQKLGSQDFLRFKVGIGHPLYKKSVSDWVLSKPISKNREVHALGIETCVDALKYFLDAGDFEAVQRRFN